MKILVIENEDFLAENLCQHLSTVTNVSSNFVTNLSDAIQRVSEERFDLILSDLSLPDSPGDEWLLEIGKLNPGQKIIIISSYPVPDCLKSSGTIEIVGYFEKPFDIHAVLEMIKSNISQEKISEQSGQQINNVNL